jgi:hypothetical protein
MDFIKKYIFLLIVFLFYANSAQAYLDPGTGSFILQMLVAGLLGGLFTLKIYWRKIKSFFTNIFTKTSTEKIDEEDEERSQ